MEQTLMDKLTILADSAKYDVACTSSGASRTARPGTMGSCYAPGCCHAFTADGRCVSLLKVLMTNCCSFDCSYCVNRKSNDVPRATFTPRELAELTIEFYRRNYIEGLFLSSAVLVSPDYTTERMLAACCGGSTVSAATSTPRPFPAPARSCWNSWAFWPTA
jgi:predicted DNA-binding helix-hairpin-helix protein